MKTPDTPTDFRPSPLLIYSTAMVTILVVFVTVFTLVSDGFAQKGGEEKSATPARSGSTGKPAAKKGDGPAFEERAKRYLKRFPGADADGDGTLTREEAKAHFRKRRAEKKTGENRPGNRRRARRPEPTHADVAYGEHERHRFDMWPVPEAESPTPLAIYIHGGGFRGGDKGSFSPGALREFHEAGIAFAALNYRLSDAGPYPLMMKDAARAVQTIRHRAAEWNLDPERIASFGGSAGAGISLWLAFHDDLADPESEDPVARQSTRLVAAATSGGQSTYDLRTFREWFGVPGLAPHEALAPFYGVEKEEDWESERVRKLMEDASPITHLTVDDAPVYMVYGRGNVPVDADTNQGVWVHHVLLGLKLQEAMEPLGLECVVRAPGVGEGEGEDPYGSFVKFLIAKLKEAP